jgi:DNA gyrase inhibitor GyrI
MISIGIIANPASGKDIRRIVSHATVIDNYEKVNIVERIILGAQGCGVDEVYIMADTFQIGNYYDLAKAWGDFCSYAEKRHLIKEGTLFIGISYDDPLVTDENNCMYDMCVTVDAAKGTNVHKLESGLYACYDFYDRLENLNKAFNEIFSLWLPYSNFNIDNRLPLEVYKSPLDEEGRMHIDICIPVV